MGELEAIDQINLTTKEGRAEYVKVWNEAIQGAASELNRMAMLVGGAIEELNSGMEVYVNVWDMYKDEATNETKTD